MLYDTELEVPDIARSKQIKECERTELANPFNAKKLKEKASKAVGKVALKWNPLILAFSSAHASSAASLALQKGKLSRSRIAEPDESVQSFPPPSTPKKTVDLQLQKAVDPKLLVQTQSRGPLQRRQNPIKADRPKLGHKVPS